MTRVVAPEVLADQMRRAASQSALAYSMGEYDRGDELRAEAEAISAALDRAAVRECGVS